MNFEYYVIRQKDMTILDGADDMVGAVKIAQKQNCACLIMQGCVITEIGKDNLDESAETLSVEE